VSAEEIRDVLLTIDGVGDGLVDNIEAEVGSLTLVPTIRFDRLTNIEGVGATVAKRIVEKF